MSQAENERRCAVIDVGSNSVRLLVADRTARRANVVFKRKITSRLLSGMRGHVLDEASILRTRDAIETLTRQARALGAQSVCAFGTSAMRDGSNSRVLVEAAREIGVELEILRGADEAAIAYRGVAAAGLCGLVDIGGGSTEALVGEDGAVRAACSVPIGAVRLCERLQGATDADAMRACAREALAPAWASVRACAAKHWIGVGGTITSLAAMSMRLTVYDPDKIEGFRLTADCVADWHERLCAMPIEARKRLPGLNPERADIIPFGAAILRAWMELAAPAEIHASDHDNLLGYLYTKYT